ncbi:TPA_asm: tail tape measure protein [Methanobrevibacter gottschalkii virus vir075]|uniref:Tape measure domain-containing protein n=1 Tax=Methanobrevibacter gottschalkii TaxID=190974 RepID=A0A1H7I9F9_9EURY|nr:hypothetical protein [Methanobrevibacter gottschalkii]SEK59203.1 hypothetical protein SAMN05216439_1181 [Methanobrevibacter gottschalkii]
MVSKQVIRVILEAEETISKAAKQAEKAIKDMGVSGKNSMDGINQASHTAQQTMSRMEKFVKSAKTRFDSLRKSGSSAFDKIKQKVGNAVNSIGKITNVSNTASKAMDRIKGVSDGVRSKFDSLKNSVSSFGSSSTKTFSEVSNSEQRALIPLQQLSTEAGIVSSKMGSSFIEVKGTVVGTGSSFDNLRNKIVNFSSTAKNRITQAFTSATASAKGKLAGLSNSISQARAKLNQFNTSARGAGGGLGFLRTAASMTAGMIGYDLVNSFAQSARANINAQSNIEAFGKRIKMTGSEVGDFRSGLDKLQSEFRKVDMDAVGASALEMGVKFNIPKEAMIDLSRTTAVMSSAFVKEGRTQEDAILAVSDAMDGQFKRMLELGIDQQKLMDNGWDGDLKNKTGLLEAMNKTLKTMGFEETAKQVKTLDDAYAAISVSGGQLLSAVLVPITPYLILISNAIYDVVTKAKGFIKSMQDAWNNMPDWGKAASLITGVGFAVSVLSIIIMTRLIPSLFTAAINLGLISGEELAATFATGGLSGAFGLLATATWSAVTSMVAFAAPILAVVAVIGVLVYAIYEVGKAFGWWTDVGSMLDAIKNNIGRLWDAFINHPDVQATIHAIGDAWKWLNDSLKPVVDWLKGIWNQIFPESAKGKVDGTRIIIDSIGDAFSGISTPIRFAIMVLQGAWSVLSSLVGTAVGIGQGIYDALKPIVCILLGCSPGIVPALGKVLEIFGTVWNAIVSLLSGVMPSVISAIQPVLDILTIIGEFLLGTFQFAWQTIIIVFMTVWNHLQVIITIFNQFLSGQITLQTMLGQIWAVIKSMFFSVLAIIIARVGLFARFIVNKAISAARGFVNAIINRITSLPGRVFSILIGVVGRIASAGSSWISNARSTASSMVSNVISHVSQLPGRVGQEFMNIGSRIVSAGSDLVNKAKNIGKNIVNGLLGAMGIHSPGTIQTKVVTEFKNMVGRVQEWIKPAGETAKEFGETLVDEFGNPTLEADTSLVQELDTPTMNIGIDTTQLNSANQDVINQYGNLANVTGNSLQSIVSQDKIAFNTIKANDTAQMSTIAATVGNKMQQMTNHVKTNMNNIVSKNKQGFISAKNNTTTQLNSMVSKTKTANSKMISSWKGMSNDVISFAGKIKTQSSQHFDKLGSKIGSFYRKLQNPGGFGAGPSSPSGRVSTVKRSGTNGFRAISNALRKYQMPQTMTLSEIRTNPFISMDNVGSYVTSSNNKFNVADLVRAGNFKIPIGLEDPFNKKSGAGWLDSVGKHINKIKSTSDKWRMKGPKIIGKYATSIGFKVGDFENGTPKIDFATFKQIAEDVFSQCHYAFYFNSNKWGSWMNAFQHGDMNCSDSSDALIAMAHSMGLPASKVHGHWGSVGHFWANVAGHKMDTTGWMNQRNWTPSASHAGPAPRGLTFGEFIDAIKSEKESSVVSTSNNNDGDDVEINGKVTVEHIHKFIDLPENVSAAEVARLINEAPEDENWLIKLIKLLVKDKNFQNMDLKEKIRINKKNARAGGI